MHCASPGSVGFRVWVPEILVGAGDGGHSRFGGVKCYLGSGRGYAYAGVRYEVYRLTPGEAHPSEVLAFRLVTFSPRAQRVRKGGNMKKVGVRS